MFPIRRFTAHLALFIFLTPLTAQEKKPAPRPIAVEDLYLFDAPRSPALSPDGKSLAYVRTTIDRSSKREINSLWLVTETKPHLLDRQEKDARQPVFSPDGEWIAFLSTRGRPADSSKLSSALPPESDPFVDIWLMRTDGNTAIPLVGPGKTHGHVFHDGFYGRVAFSPDSKKLVFVADDGRPVRTSEEMKAGVTIVREDQGEGYTGYRPAQVWVAEIKKSPEKWWAEKVHRLTDDDVWYGDPQWSPDGNTIYVHANKTEDRESVRFSINKNFDIWAIDAATGKQTQLTKGPGPEVSPRVSGDGKKIVCLSVPRKGSHRDVFNFLLVSAAGEGEPRVLFDHHGKDADMPPHAPPAFPLPQDCWDEDGRALFYQSEVGVETQTASLDLASARGRSLILPKLGDTPADAKGFLKRLALQRHLLPAGNTFLKDRLLGEQSTITWKNEGFTIEGVLTVPSAEVAKPPYKLFLYPHGGPHSRSTRGFDFTVQVFAAQGYAVLQPNFRGSSGYGQKFIDADRNDLGGGDFRDCMSGIDHLIDKGLADKGRLFIYGVSYGGYMTSWSVTQTDRFRAAVAQNAVTDLTMMWALSDLQSWTEWEFAGRPWEVPEKMRQHSPLTHVAKVKTPTLILHAAKDRRVPLPLGKAFHQALLARGVPTEMVVYPDEGHGIRQPQHREDVLRRVLAWFEKHGGK